MPLSVDDIKLYLRVDGDAEDELIQAQLSAAEAYIAGKVSKTQRLVKDGEPLALADDGLYQQCVKLMVVHWYENRAIEAAGNRSPVHHTVDAILAHIEGCGDYE